MKITKRQLKRIIKEEKLKLISEAVGDPMDEAIYEEANQSAYAMVEDMLNQHGQTAEALNAITLALRDVADMVENDARLVGDAMEAGDFA